MSAEFLVDTNVLVYRFDPRFPDKQRKATELLRIGIRKNSIRIPHQAIVEFVAAATRPVSHGKGLMSQAEAWREAEEMMVQFEILYPVEGVLRRAIRGAATYQLSWFDAHLWAYADHYGLALIYSEDFERDRRYGPVRIVNPFV